MPNSCFEKGSAAWTYSTATNIVIINGMVASLVPNPNIINREQATSENTARASESEALKPKSGGNCTSPESNVTSLGIPCVNIRVAIITLTIKIAIPDLVDECL